MATLELALAEKIVAILEAKERVRGRMHTIKDQRFEIPVALGAEYVHGKLPISLVFFEKAPIKKLKVDGDRWRQQGGVITSFKIGMVF